MRLPLVLCAVLLAIGGACTLPDPGEPCGEPESYARGTWTDAEGRPIADTLTEDSIPTRWHCTPDASLVRWFASLDD